MLGFDDSSHLLIEHGTSNRQCHSLRRGTTSAWLLGLAAVFSLAVMAVQSGGSVSRGVDLELLRFAEERRSRAARWQDAIQDSAIEDPNKPVRPGDTSCVDHTDGRVYSFAPAVMPFSCPPCGDQNHEPVLWPGGVVPYEIEDVPGAPHVRVGDELNSTYGGIQNSALNAMFYIEQVSSVRFVRRNSEPNFVRFVRDSSPCDGSSNFGVCGGMQEIHIPHIGCYQAMYGGQPTEQRLPGGAHPVRSKANVLQKAVFTTPVGMATHETMHALGLFHTQAYPNRDAFVQIHWDNIKGMTPSGVVGTEQYEMIPFDTFKDPKQAEVAAMPFDFESVLIYMDTAYAINSSLPTMTRPDGSPLPRGTGQRVRMSESDISKINTLYPERRPPAGVKTAAGDVDAPL